MRHPQTCQVGRLTFVWTGPSSSSFSCFFLLVLLLPLLLDKPERYLFWPHMFCRSSVETLFFVALVFRPRCLIRGCHKHQCSVGLRAQSATNPTSRNAEPKAVYKPFAPQHAPDCLTWQEVCRPLGNSYNVCPRDLTRAAGRVQKCAKPLCQKLLTCGALASEAHGE